MISNLIGFIEKRFSQIDPVIGTILEKCTENKEISKKEGLELLKTTGIDMFYLFLVADYVRSKNSKNYITFVINRNINFTNICRIGCEFCAFSREEPFELSINEIVKRSIEAKNKGCTEICIQGGINPDFNPDIYENILRSIKLKVPDIHIHGFSPMEIYNCAQLNNINIKEALILLKEAGLDSIPGTAAEILDPKIRKKICPNKIDVQIWTEVIKTAHKLNIPTTSTIMYGHLDNLEHRMNHLDLLRNIQKETHGFTEFVPLSFMHSNTPLYKFNSQIKGSTGIDDLKLYAVSRLYFQNYIDNIQVSWVKLGPKFAQFAMNIGANDFGGTLFDENISKSAGASFGEYMPINEFIKLIKDLNRTPAQRDTLYNILKVYK
ncbi:MAG: 5-amino-6-(D-ribitylamino)uracil--L-tyrosine 4-hydroxyphenyl transferase CofH [Candidatus Helarchaeota archaeon]